MKSYRENELKHYVIAVILMYFVVVNGVNSFINSGDTNTIKFIAEIFEIAIISSSIYAFVFVLDSIYSGKLKRKLVFAWMREPGMLIFEQIEKAKNDIRFTQTDVKKYYSDIYANMPENRKENKVYQNQQWYSIYHNYKDVEMVAASAKDYRLCRDIYIATINILIVYLFLCLASDIVIFNCRYIMFLIFLLVCTNIATRNKGKKWVYNVVAYDVIQKKNENQASCIADFLLK